MVKAAAKRSPKISSFIQTLVNMLSNEPTDLICWDVEGKSFTIKNPSRFTDETLPKYFKHNNFSSLVRQLNIYEFKKVLNEKAPDFCTYCHPSFIRDRPELLKNINRKLPAPEHRVPKETLMHDVNAIGVGVSSNSINFEKRNLEQEIQDLKAQIHRISSSNNIESKCAEKLEKKIKLSSDFSPECLGKLNQILLRSYLSQCSHYETEISEGMIIQGKILRKFEEQRVQMQKQKVKAYRNLLSLSNQANKKLFEPMKQKYYESGGSNTGTRDSSKTNGNGNFKISSQGSSKNKEGSSDQKQFKSYNREFIINSDENAFQEELIPFQNGSKKMHSIDFQDSEKMGQNKSKQKCHIVSSFQAKRPLSVSGSNVCIINITNRRRRQDHVNGSLQEIQLKRYQS